MSWSTNHQKNEGENTLKLKDEGVHVWTLIIIDLQSTQRSNSFKIKTLKVHDSFLIISNLAKLCKAEGEVLIHLHLKPSTKGCRFAVSHVETLIHSEDVWCPLYAYQDQQIGTGYFTGSEFTFVPFIHCDLTLRSWLEMLKTAWDCWKHPTLLTPFWVWRTLNEVCSSFTFESMHLIIYAYDDEGFRNELGNGGKKKKKSPAHFLVTLTQEARQWMTVDGILEFSCALFKSISGSQGKAAWGAYIRFMSLYLSQDKDKKPQEKCGESVSNSGYMRRIIK